MKYLRFVAILLISSFLFSFSGDNEEALKIKSIIITKAYSYPNSNIGFRRRGQIQFNIETQQVLKRKNEAKRFKVRNDIEFPEELLDSNFINQLVDYKLKPCEFPVKNFYYKVDIEYYTCHWSRFPKFIKSYIIPYYPYNPKSPGFNTTNVPTDPMEKLIFIRYNLNYNKKNQ